MYIEFTIYSDNNYHKNMFNILSKAIHFVCRCLIAALGYFWAAFYTLRYNRNGNVFVCHARLQGCKVSIKGSNHRIVIKGGVIRNTKFEITGSGHQITMGKGVAFNEGGRIVMEDNNCSLIIGDGTDFVSCFFAIRDDGTKVIIGNDCMFSALTIVRTSDAHSVLVDGKRVNRGKDVVVGDHVWVGYGANILKGTTIESHSIVGTQSVVAGLLIPEGCVAAGNPARIVKQGIDWDRQRLPC